ncbi:hypothetical protein, partial [Caulobacter sp. LARHSG274]
MDITSDGRLNSRNSTFRREVDEYRADRYRSCSSHSRQPPNVRPPMPEPSSPADDSRISGLAAITALGGHAAIILALLLLAGRAPEMLITPTVVGVTLVNSQPGEPAKSAANGPPSPAPTEAALSEARREPVDASGDRLDSLTAIPDSLAARPALAAADAGGASRPTTASAASAASGSSRADQGLGQGEAAEGVDLYAAASLPSVGARPAAPSGDLWQRVAPCWRSAAPREA